MRWMHLFGHMSLCTICSLAACGGTEVGVDGQPAGDPVWAAGHGAQIRASSRLPAGAALDVLETASADHPEFLRKLRNLSAYRVNEYALRRDSICGRPSLQQVNSYDGRLGVSKSFVVQHKGPVGAMTRTNSPAGSKYCSGTLVASNVFLTASHCVGTDTVGQYVAFNYEQAAGATTVLTQDFSRIIAVGVEGAMLGFDYALLLLDGTPGLRHGWTVMKAEDPALGARLTIIQHPNGEPKQLDSGTESGINGDYLTYDTIDTLPGSSGSGILDADGSLVGVHTNGGCTDAGGSNSGVRMTRIVTAGALLGDGGSAGK